MSKIETASQGLPHTIKELALESANEVNNNPKLSPRVGIIVITDSYIANSEITLQDRVDAMETYLNALKAESRKWLEEVVDGKPRLRQIIDERMKTLTANGTNINQRRH